MIKERKHCSETIWDGEPNGCSLWGFEHVVVENFIHALISLPIISYICYEIYSVFSSPGMDARVRFIVLIISSLVWLPWLLCIYVLLEPLRRKVRYRLTTYSIQEGNLVISLKCFLFVARWRKPLALIKEPVVVYREKEYYTFVFGLLDRWITRIRLKSQKYSPSSPIVSELFEFCFLDKPTAERLLDVLKGYNVPLDSQSADIIGTASGQTQAKGSESK